MSAVSAATASASASDSKFVGKGVIDVLAAFPTRLLSAWTGEEGNTMEVAHIRETWPTAANRFEASTTEAATAAQAVTPTLPGPWAFFTSSYMLGLFAMAILMHRIQNIVVPTRPPGHGFGARRRDRSFLRIVYDFILPLDVTRTMTRFVLHLPTLYFMGKMLLIWSILLAQACAMYPQRESGLVPELGDWVKKQEMSQISWATFCAVCAAFCVEGFVKGLDGVGVGIAAHMQANTSPFNLVGYAFMLHIYSSPGTHTYRPLDLPSRPDKHIIFTIAIPLLQLTIFHLLSIHKRWSSHRLIPTALSSLLSLTHFHGTLLLHHTKLRAGSTKPSTPYPLLNYIPNIFETCLILTTVLTVALNCLTQLLLSGSVVRPLLGLGGGSLWAPSWEEDFGVLLLRIGTASLEATGLRGWGNEVGTVVAAPPVAQQQLEYGSLDMTRAGVTMGAPGTTITTTTTSSGRRKRRVLTMRGWRNEVRDVRLSTGERQDGTVGIVGVIWFSRGWFREAWTYLTKLWVIGWGLVGVGWDLVRGRKVRDGWTARTRMPQPVRRVAVLRQDRNHARAEDSGADDDGLYERFRRGEELSDDEGEWSEGDSPEEAVSDDGEYSANEWDEAVRLYADLQSDEAASSSALVAHAHMSHRGGSPLTRRQYQNMFTLTPPELEPRAPSRPPVAADDDSSRRNCVICVSEERQIICWPCRCLSMCDECRETLASRSSASKHRCPCCRKPVEGYSRIFIP